MDMMTTMTTKMKREKSATVESLAALVSTLTSLEAVSRLSKALRKTGDASNDLQLHHSNLFDAILDKCSSTN